MAAGGEPALTGQVANHEGEAVDPSPDLRLAHRRTAHADVEPTGLVEHHLRSDRSHVLLDSERQIASAQVDDTDSAVLDAAT